MQLPDHVRAKLDDFAQAQEELRMKRLDLDLQAAELSEEVRGYADQLSGLIVGFETKERVAGLDWLHGKLRKMTPSPRRPYVSCSYTSEPVVVSFLDKTWRNNTTVRGANTGIKEREFKSGCMGVYYPSKPGRIFLKSPVQPHETLELVKRPGLGWAVVSEANWDGAGRATPGSSPRALPLSRY